MKAAKEPLKNVCHEVISSKGTFLRGERGGRRDFCFSKGENFIAYQIELQQVIKLGKQQEVGL